MIFLFAGSDQANVFAVFAECLLFAGFPGVGPSQHTDFLTIDVK